MTEVKPKKIKPDIRAITKLVPPAGNLVQGQSELAIDPELAKEAYEIIAASQNHYGSSRKAFSRLRKAVAEKIKKYNNIELTLKRKSPNCLITPGGTGALVGIAQSYLQENPRSFSSRIIRITAASSKNSAAKRKLLIWTKI